ncbi:MAG TPA: peroxide stress protein YaaA [Oceanospirillaceae bacterium]|nr:peroxide stress protein YaaA [Oceanospirillaceae bacterium]
MIIVLSPAKTLDFETPAHVDTHTQPNMLAQSQELIEQLREVSPQELAVLMKLSDKLAALNVARYGSWQQPFTQHNAKQSVLAFKGDVYTGLDADTLSSQDLNWAQSHLRILSGLYGLLRPLDLMQAYRLEMGTKFANHKGKDLYTFWDQQITQQLNQELGQQANPILVNLASNEYFKAVKAKHLDAEIITPVFKDQKNGQYKIISFYAKKARGYMSHWMIKNKVTKSEDLKNFDAEGYKYSKKLSTESEPVFLRN